jgi:hypothetical protein
VSKQRLSIRLIFRIFRKIPKAAAHKSLILQSYFGIWSVLADYWLSSVRVVRPHAGLNV